MAEFPNWPRSSARESNMTTNGEHRETRGNCIGSDERFEHTVATSSLGSGFRFPRGICKACGRAQVMNGWVLDKHMPGEGLVVQGRGYKIHAVDGRHGFKQGQGGFVQELAA
jgi:hypothetical protein